MVAGVDSGIGDHLTCDLMCWPWNVLLVVIKHDCQECEDFEKLHLPMNEHSLSQR